MLKRLLKCISTLLVLVMLIQMVPVQAFENGQTETAPSTPAVSPEEISVVAELPEQRTEFGKTFLLSNGLYMAAVYTDPIHYQKDGQWKDIDNTLTLHTDGTYQNTAGIWEVAFPQQSGGNQAVTITKDGYTLSFGMPKPITSGGNQIMSADATVTAQLSDNTALLAARAEAEHPETVLDKLSSRLSYDNIHTGTDVVYDLSSNRVKESVILSQYDSGLQGFAYFLNTGDMIPVLAEEGHITFYDETQSEVIMVMPAPFMEDSASQITTDIQVALAGSGSKYVLSYTLPQDWLSDNSRQWPVVLDPVVQADLEITNVRDASVAEYATFSYTSPNLETGYYSTEGKQRSYLKYAELPQLTSADVVVEARITLKKFVTSASSAPVEVHKVLGNWESESITWANKPDYNPIIEDFVICREERHYTWDITDIARDWYATGNNYGMLFKTSDAVENGGVNNFKQFRSSDYSNYDDSIPNLEIIFLNNNGLEDYWDYSSASAGRAGSGSVNIFTGNLIWTRSTLGFIGNRMPVAIDLVYNANDAANNLFGLGYGWRTSYHQRVYQWAENSAYYVWEDSDGTAHYFIWNAAKSAYTDADNEDSPLLLTVSGSGTSKTYTLTDEKDNKRYFDSSGRLYRSENNQQTKSSVQIAYSTGNRISQITDGAGRVYTFTYPGDLLTRISFKGTGSNELSYVTLGYSGGNLTAVTDKDGKGGSYTYHANHILATASETGGYKLSYTYNNPTGDYAPWRVKKVQEYDGTTPAGQLTFTYGGNQTVLTSSHYENGSYVQDSALTYQFNDIGNTVSVQDDEGKAQFMAYNKNIWNDQVNKANQLSQASKLQNTVVNVRGDGSFEWGTLWENHSDNLSMSYSIATSTGYIGNKSLMISGSSGEALYTAAITVKPQETYTFSGYVKTTAGKVKIGFCKTDNFADAVYSDTVSTNGQWTRLQVSYTNKSETNETVYALFMGVDNATAYLDCVQIEKAPTASRYNLVSVGDFQWASTQWRSTNTSTGDGLAIAPSSAPGLKNQAYKLVGDYTSRKYISQDIKVIGEEGDSFVFGGWAMGNSASLDNIAGEIEKDFSLKLTIGYTDGTKEEQYVRFNPDVTTWQFACGAIVAKKAYTAVTIDAFWSKNANTVYFDGLQVFKEEYGSSFTYDDKGNVVSVIDLQNKETEYEYDENSNLTQIIEDGQAKMTYEYDNWHNVETATTDEGLTYEFEYDTYGNNNKVSISSGGVTLSSSATYTPNGNLLSSATDALGNVTNYSYDADTGVLEWVQLPEDSDSTRTEYTYDDMYRQASIVADTDSQLNLSVNYTYTDEDLLATLQTPSTTYMFDYGDFDQRTAVRIGSRTLVSYAYDSKKQLDRLTYGNNDFVDNDYDAKGRLIKQTYETGETVEYAYDNSGNLATVADSATGITTTYYYDLLDRQVGYREKSATLDHSVTCIYNEDNQVSSVTEVINGATTTYTYTYDEDNRVTNVAIGDLMVSYSYDGFGRLASRTVKNGDTVIQSSTPAYAPGKEAGTTTGQISSYNGYTYTYDKNGNILSVTDGTYTTSYEYDSANQLTRENNQQLGFTHTWTYDDGGNIRSRSEYPYTTGTLGTPTNTVAYTYKSSTIWGDMIDSYGTSDYLPHDGAGNLRYDGTWIYNWENGRELTSMTQGETAWTFSYDANGMRTKRTDGTAQSTYTYVYDGSQLVQMTVDGYTLDFLYDASGTPLAFSMGSMSFYYDTSLQGDVVAIRDTSGNVLVRYAYDAWGNFEIIQNHQIAEYNPLLYRGYVYDHEIGLYYLQSRYYDPEWGRFINGDGYAATGQGLIGNNMFAYCNNNPIMFKDSLGSRPVVNDGSEETREMFLYSVGYKDRVQENIEKCKAILYPKDVTAEVDAALKAALSETESFIQNYTAPFLKYYHFYRLVKPGAAWDIKLEKPWTETIGTDFPGQHTIVLYHGARTTPHELGNYTYAVLGHAHGIPLHTLLLGSYYAAGFPLNKKDLKIELDDWPIIFGGYTYADSDFWEG